MKNNYLFLILCILATFSLTNCKKKHKVISGVVQKGPFINGSNVTIFEINKNFEQTGKSFVTTTNNTGGFEINSVALVSNNVVIKADGFYYNEVCGTNSVAPITLSCIANVSSSSTLNVNVLTHLEKARVENLIASGTSFSAAKTQAQAEVLSIFNIVLQGLPNSETMDISTAGNGNEILLAVSAILQGYRTESELLLLMANISNDIATDGVLNNANVQSDLINHAMALDLVAIKNNVANFYTTNGVTTQVPNFETYVQQFLNTSAFIKTNTVFDYPQTGDYGNNLLFKTQTAYTGGQYSFNGKIKNCTALKIRIHKTIPNLPNSMDLYAYDYASNKNLTISAYDFNKDEQFFTVTNPALPFDLKVTKYGSASPTDYAVEYFENNAATPSFTKNITIN
jgi:hypothetical protein